MGYAREFDDGDTGTHAIIEHSCEVFNGDADMVQAFMGSIPPFLIGRRRSMMLFNQLDLHIALIGGIHRKIDNLCVAPIGEMLEGNILELKKWPDPHGLFPIARRSCPSARKPIA
jgi:hypothetical protein